MKKNIILLGAGGHMTSVIETIQNDKRFNIFGFLDNDKKKIGKTIFGVKVLGNDNELKKIRKKVDYAFRTVGCTYPCRFSSIGRDTSANDYSSNGNTRDFPQDH